MAEKPAVPAVEIAYARATRGARGWVADEKGWGILGLAVQETIWVGSGWGCLGRSPLPPAGRLRCVSGGGNPTGAGYPIA